MITFCILCKSEIPPERQRRGGITCCVDHAREYRRQRRAERATKFCRLCGRKSRKPKIATPVLSEHTETVERSEPNL
jgi:hypothetical protein